MEKDEMDLKSAVHIVDDFGKSRKESENETIARMLKGKDISEVVNLMFCSGNTYNRRILRFFRGFCKWVPVAVM